MQMVEYPDGDWICNMDEVVASGPTDERFGEHVVMGPPRATQTYDEATLRTRGLVGVYRKEKRIKGSS